MRFTFTTKQELSEFLGISRQTLRRKLKEIKELDTGRRQLLYPWEVRLIYRAFGIIETVSN
ncbi:helix-turn-helix domain-containing protein [uncultured Aquimarina sp.]|uniref:helix-turn-helix domain-containing protein n=1 Tax=uncultured Aquimarina sp. TaxID=575652 RepID=UPI0026170613|nr:helix-turn-helix domain-containing protein [uncultured Aquimarina sp.]